jgi:hypothetical protein
LVHLYTLLGVEIVDADYSFSCSRFTRGAHHGGAAGGGDGSGGDDQPLFGYNRFGPLVLPQLSAYWFGRVGRFSGSTNGAHSKAWRDTNVGLMLQLLRLLGRAGAYLATAGGVAGLSHVSLGDFLAAKGYSPAFCAELLYPMLSVVCTCTYGAVAAYPAGEGGGGGYLFLLPAYASLPGLSVLMCGAREERKSCNAMGSLFEDIFCVTCALWPGVALDYFAQHGIFNPPWRKTCQCRVVGGVRKVRRHP